jgi:tetratricopeptide (TPR) repeat protein
MPGKRPAKRKKKAAAKSSAGGKIVPLDRRGIESLFDLLAGGGEQDDVAAAQDIMYDAWEAGSGRKRVALAKKALAASADCADAYVLLAQETARSAAELLDLYRQGVEAGERALGKQAFKEDAGHFWGILETRPYMRARHGLAQALWATGARAETVAHYQDMLRLNPNDNQGIRYELLTCLLTLGHDDDAGKLLRRYKNDGSCAWAYSRALHRFRREGDSKAARAALEQALESNAHVPAYLSGRKRLPARLPALIGPGGEDEAVAYVADAEPAWANAPGALAWLAAGA